MKKKDTIARHADRAPGRFDPLKWIFRQFDSTRPKLEFPVGRPRAVPT